jgi:hypothetical protein
MNWHFWDTFCFLWGRSRNNLKRWRMRSTLQTIHFLVPPNIGTKVLTLQLRLKNPADRRSAVKITSLSSKILLPAAVNLKHEDGCLLGCTAMQQTGMSLPTLQISSWCPDDAGSKNLWTNSVASETEGSSPQSQQPPPILSFLFRNKLGVLRWGGLLDPAQNPGPPPVGCPRLLIQYIRSYPPYLEVCLLHPQRQDAPCLGDRGPNLHRRTSETSVNSHQSTRRYNPRDSHFHINRLENLKL